MKKTLLFSLALLGIATTSVSAQKMASCCARPVAATEAFGLLASNQEFVSGHDAPLPYRYEGEGQMIEFSTTDGQAGHAFEIKSAKASNKYLFVVHEWWGLNDYIKKEAAAFASELPGVNIIALDLYDGKVATDAAEAGTLMGAVKTERAAAIIKGAQAYAGPKAQFASIGWCFGGGWSLQAALLGGKQTAGCVMYYGMPEKDVAKLKTLNSDVLGIFAVQDKWISPTVVSEFRGAMADAGKKLTVRSFTADHAFANPSNPKYDPNATKEAHKLALAYLREKFNIKG